MAELFRHIDHDGDRVALEDNAEDFGAGALLGLSIGDAKGWASAVYLDRDAALRLAAALQEHFNTQAGSATP